MRKSTDKSRRTSKPDWATKIFELRLHAGMNQTAFGQRLHSSAMSISRWERGAQEPTAESYIELGNMGGDPLCWYFWGRAGLRNEDLMRVLPTFRNRISQTKVVHIRSVRAGAGKKRSKIPQLVAIPVLKYAISSRGGKMVGM